MEEEARAPTCQMKLETGDLELNKLLDDDAIVSSDSGTIATWRARYVEMRGDTDFRFPDRSPPWRTAFLIVSERRWHFPAVRWCASSEMAV